MKGVLFMQRPFTIQTYFPRGNTLGYHISQIPTRTIQALYIPRSELKKTIADRTELKYNGVYFLFEENQPTQNEKSLAYIGESEDIAERLQHHDKNKDNWTTAVVFTTTGEENQLTKADIKYLENYSYQKALEAERYEISQNKPTKSFVHEAREADLMDMYKSMNDLLTFLGFPLFSPINNESKETLEDNLYFLDARDSKARAIYSQDGMIVLKGSQVAPTETKSFPMKQLYNELIHSNVIDKKGVFIKDYTFTKPSTAAQIVTRSSVNGWTVW